MYICTVLCQLIAARKAMTTHGPVPTPIKFVKGRGVGSNQGSRFHVQRREGFDDGWDVEDEVDAERRLGTSVMVRDAKSVISYNTSPDIGFTQSINPFQGCEHGCVYCYARPSHAYLDLSPGLDFETKLFAKGNAAEVLRRELSSKAYKPDVIALGANTDPYQPIERELGITRAILEVLAEFNAPVSITTKSALVTRDLDILGPMAAKGLARVNVSLATLDPHIARIMDPRAPAPHRRLRAMQQLSAAGVPTSVFASPMIPAINDMEVEAILEAASEAGARNASMIVLRLPREVKDLVHEWLRHHFPLRADHVISLVRQMRDGKDNESQFGTRMRGTGIYAELLRRRFQLARRKQGLDRPTAPLNTVLFKAPQRNIAHQKSLF